MGRERVDFWRLSLFAALGLCPNACGARTTDNALPESRPSACGESTAILVAGQLSGLQTCASNELRHRASADVQCASSLPRAEIPYAELASPDDCTSDAECTASPHGFCDLSGSQSFELVCNYGCLTDADCAADQLCECGDPVGRCVDSTCKHDADCGEGLLCAYWGETFWIGCPVTTHYVCQTADDECAVDEDCPQVQEYGMRCSVEGATRKCVEIEGIVCGRPFLIEGTPRLATLLHSVSSESLSPIGAGLTTDSRAAIGMHWAQVGLMEHASIAAFARFALQLMHVGAPHSLLVSAQQAMLDETHHAQLCFDIAARVLGYHVGAGKLPMAEALSNVTLTDIVRLTVREGCVGETVAAMEASEGAALTTEPTIKATLQQIQVDELRHAELGWRFVQWALQEDAKSECPSLHTVMIEELELAKRDVRDGECAEEPLAVELAAYGVLSPTMRNRVRREAVLRVIAPCAAELLRVTAPRERSPHAQELPIAAAT